MVKSFYIKLLSIILISCLGIIVYSNTFHCSFHFDDGMYIVDNFVIRNIADLHNIWSFLPCRFITYLSFALNYHFHQLHVFGYHVFNLAVHLMTAILVWWLVLLTLSTPAMKDNKITQHANLIALLAGLVFVAHPVQTEAVTYIVQRSASLAALFYVATLCLYAKSRLKIAASSRFSGTPRNDTVLTQRVCYIGALLTAVMAMFTKEIAITLPLMILLYEFSFFTPKKNFNWAYLTPFLLTLFIIPLTMFLTPANQATNSSDLRHAIEGTTKAAPMDYFFTQFRVIVTYIRLIFLPLNQNLDYDYPISRSIFELPTLISFLFLVGILYFAKRLFSKYRLVSFSIFWFFLTLLPESLFPLDDVIFEHRLYLPLVGYSIFLVSGAYYLFGKNRLKMMVIVLMMVVGCNSVLTYQRNKVWKDEFTLWKDAVEKSPHKARPYNNRGVTYVKQNEFTKSLSDFTKAIETNPKDVEAYYNRGTGYYYQDNFTQAITDFTKALELNPTYAKAYNNRGNAYNSQGNFTQAMNDYNKAIELNPKYAQAYNNRGLIYYQQGNFTQAMTDFTKAIEINPEDAQAYNNRAAAYYQLKEYDKAWAKAFSQASGRGQ